MARSKKNKHATYANNTVVTWTRGGKTYNACVHKVFQRGLAELAKRYGRSTKAQLGLLVGNVDMHKQQATSIATNAIMAGMLAELEKTTLELDSVMELATRPEVHHQHVQADLALTDAEIEEGFASLRNAGAPETGLVGRFWPVALGVITGAGVAGAAIAAGLV